ncbi:hypothetical protein MJO52_11900 [Microbulbifer variabilis]|uniref:Uncharacterized protein n=1 Tax=Microbulbifer variabilis TaxID=266805 RepID=A0ABY4V685_9GAMM|nr:hypothetical protein [Microbulbifer variabilis]USD19786.1 hypothetical protein MJO52_11900 [Microbulbifer variabilis]
MSQRALKLYHTVTEHQVYNAWLNNAEINSACSWKQVVRDELIFGCLFREAAYTYRGQRPQQFAPFNSEETAMSKEVFLLDIAEARRVRLALALCRERIACPDTTTVSREEAVQELRAAQEIFLEHEARADQLKDLNRELGGVASA